MRQQSVVADNSNLEVITAPPRYCQKMPGSRVTDDFRACSPPSQKTIDNRQARCPDEWWRFFRYTDAKKYYRSSGCLARLPLAGYTQPGEGLRYHRFPIPSRPSPHRPQPARGVLVRSAGYNRISRIFHSSCRRISSLISSLIAP